MYSHTTAKMIVLVKVVGNNCALGVEYGEGTGEEKAKVPRAGGGELQEQIGEEPPRTTWRWQRKHLDGSG